MKQIVSFGHTSVTTHLTPSVIGSGTVPMASMNWTVRRCFSTLKSKRLSNAAKLNTIASSSWTIELMWTGLVSISIERAMGVIDCVGATDERFSGRVRDDVSVRLQTPLPLHEQQCLHHSRTSVRSRHWLSIWRWWVGLSVVVPEQCHRIPLQGFIIETDNQMWCIGGKSARLPSKRKHLVLWPFTEE